MLISYSRFSDCSMWLPFWQPLSQIVRLTLKFGDCWTDYSSTTLTDSPRKTHQPNRNTKNLSWTWTWVVFEIELYLNLCCAWKI